MILHIKGIVNEIDALRKEIKIYNYRNFFTAFINPVSTAEHIHLSCPDPD